MEWGTGEIVSAVTLCISALGWTISGGFRTKAYWREQDQREWQRLEELTHILYNNENAHGGWAQLAAIAELKSLRRRKPVVREIAKEAADFWRSKSTNARLIKALDDVATSL